MPKAEPRRVTRNIARAEFTDGKIVEYNLSKPMIVLELEDLGLAGDLSDADSGTAGLLALWIAAGKPGANGHELSLDAAKAFMRSWLKDVEAVEFSEGEPTPPPKQPGTSRTSAG
jgi:hypothetical protein